MTACGVQIAANEENGGNFNFLATFNFREAISKLALESSKIIN